MLWTIFVALFILLCAAGDGNRRLGRSRRVNWLAVALGAARSLLPRRKG